MVSTRARCSTGLSPKVRAKDGIVVRHTRRSFAQHVNDEARLPTLPFATFRVRVTIGIGIDLAKHVFQVHGVNGQGKIVLSGHA